MAVPVILTVDNLRRCGKPSQVLLPFQRACGLFHNVRMTLCKRLRGNMQYIEHNQPYRLIFFSVFTTSILSTSTTSELHKRTACAILLCRYVRFALIGTSSTGWLENYALLCRHESIRLVSGWFCSCCETLALKSAVNSNPPASIPP